jgi:hypothetical protein
MPGVTCGSCGAEDLVRFARGTRLAGIPCRKCGLPDLKMNSAARPSPGPSRTYELCVIDGKRGLHHRHPPYAWTLKHGVADHQYPAGSPCCWWHQPVPAARVRYDTVVRDLDHRLGGHDPSNSWAEHDRPALEALTAGPPPACPMCQAAGIGPRRFHTQALLFADGTALVATCEGCAHTILLATRQASDVR